MPPASLSRSLLLGLALAAVAATALSGTVPSHAGTPKPTAPATGTHEESAPELTLGPDWKGATSTHDSGGGYATLTAPGSARFTFYGTGIRWVTRTNNYSGIGLVRIDQAKPTSVDLYSKTEKFQQVVYVKKWSKPGQHTIEISRTGKLNKASAGRGISLDAFVVTDSTKPPMMPAPSLEPAHTGMQLSWPASTADDVTAYRLYRRAGSGKYVRIAQLPADQLSYHDVGLVHGTSYRYRLTAVDSSGNVSTTAPSSGAPMAEKAAIPGRYAKCPAATEQVKTAVELDDALATARAGTVIRLAPGTYRGYFSTSATGTKAAPVWICGPRSAVIDPGNNDRGSALSLEGASHVIVTGLTIKQAQKGVMVTGSHNTLSDLHISDIGNEAIHLRSNASDNQIVANLIERTGQTVPTYGEGIYVGSDPAVWCTFTACQPDRSDRNLIEANTIRSVTAEAVEVKAGAADGDIRGNIVNGSAMTAENSGGWIVVKGNGWLVEANQGTKAPENGFTATYSRADGWGRDNVFVRNRATTGNASGYGVWVQKGIGNLVSCDNSASISGRAMNVACRK